ncbi:MAG: ATP-binding protein [Dehalococcoidia bacterium]
MRLKRIHLKNFKRFPDYRVEFSPGINVVKGPLNETGKSTLLEGIIVALFHNPKSAAKDIKNYAAWGSTGQFQTSLEFEHDGKGYLLEKDFGKGTVRLACVESGEQIETFKEASERMSELLGTKSDRLFVCSCCIRQSQVTEISSGKKEIGESLEEVVTGGKESTLASQVIQKLESTVADMKRGLDKPAKNPGTLATLKNRTEDLLARHEQVRDEVSKVEEQKVQLLEVNKELARVRAEYEKLRALLEQNRQRQEIEATLDRLGKEYDRIEQLLGRIRKHGEDLNKADEELEDIEGIRDRQEVLDLRKALDLVHNRREAIENDLAQRQKELEEVRGKKGGGPARFLGSPASLAVAVALFAGGLVGVLVGHLYLLALVVVGALLFVLAQRAKAAIDRERSGIGSIGERIGKMRESLEELGREEQQFLAKAKCSALSEFSEKEKSFHQWLGKKEEAQLRLDEILSKSTIEDIEKQRADLVKNMAVEQHNLTEDMKQTKVSPEQYVELQQKLKGVEAGRDELDDRRRNALAIIKAARHDAEEQARLEEELAGLNEALRREETRARVYDLARDVIVEARLDVISSADEALQGEMQKYLSVFTNRKYERVSMSKEDLEFWVYSEEKGDWVRPEELSGGVIDEFYLAFRLALARLVFGDRRPPLILDDPFVNFDSVRLASTLAFLKTLSSDYQVIIFALGDLYDGVADNIISLADERKLF